MRLDNGYKGVKIRVSPLEFVEVLWKYYNMATAWFGRGMFPFANVPRGTETSATRVILEGFIHPEMPIYTTYVGTWDPWLLFHAATTFSSRWKSGDHFPPVASHSWNLHSA
jgi:hypothetical protein